MCAPQSVPLENKSGCGMDLYMPSSTVAGSERQANWPLAGVRVLEFAQYAAGPLPAMMLADWGADVVKVEAPIGDGIRSWPPHADDPEGEPYGYAFASLNRNKRSVVLDLKNPMDVSRAKALIGSAHVVLENYRPGVMGRFGLGYEAMSKENPGLVYCSISGYGQSGPYATRGAFDVAIQAVSGMMSVTGEEGRPPIKCGVPVGDMLAGAYAAFGIAVALRQSEQSGKGAYIDCSMLGCMLEAASLQTSDYWGRGVAPGKIASRHPRNAPYQAFQASDKPFVIAAGTDRLWWEVCEAVGRPELKQDPRFAELADRARNDLELEAVLQAIFVTKPAEHWLAEFERRGVPFAPVYDFAEVTEDEHVLANGMVREMKLPGGQMTKTIANPLQMTGCEFSIYRRPPRLGEHNDEVFDEWLTEPQKVLTG